jgi:hypothetical protein
MSHVNVRTDEQFAVRIPADIEAPDTLVFGLTARQAAIVATAAAAGYLTWQTLGTRLPLPAVAVLLIPLAAAAAVLALGRRDGLSLDAWLLAAVRHRRAPAAGGARTRTNPGRTDLGPGRRRA